MNLKKWATNTKIIQGTSAYQMKKKKPTWCSGFVNRLIIIFSFHNALSTILTSDSPFCLLVSLLTFSLSYLKIENRFSFSFGFYSFLGYICFFQNYFNTSSSNAPGLMDIWNSFGCLLNITPEAFFLYITEYLYLFVIVTELSLTSDDNREHASYY